MVLTADEREAHPEFEKELLDVRDKPAFEFGFFMFFGQRKELERVRVFQSLSGQISGRGWQRFVEIRDGLSLSTVEVGLDLVNEYGP